jgi:U4/U6 small nuclear ribonucleoprotein PRP31
MSLADELLADLDDIGDDLGNEESDQQEDDIMEATEGLAEPSNLATLSVQAFAQLANSDRLNKMMESIEAYLEDPRTDRVIGPVEADPEYQLIVDSNNILVEMDNEIITVHKYIRDKYSMRFPELESLVPVPLEYIKTVQLLQNDLEVTKVGLDEVLPAATIMVVSVTASTTQGQRIEQDELDRVLEACDMGLELNEKKLKILSYVESQMSFIAPNLSAIAGPTVATKLMGIAGGLTALSKIPACNILVSFCES